MAPRGNDPHLRWRLALGYKTWDWESGQTLTEIPVAAQRMAFDPSGRRIAIAHGGLAGIWDVDTGRKLRTFVGHEGSSGTWRSAPTDRSWLPWASTARCGSGMWTPGSNGWCCADTSSKLGGSPSAPTVPRLASGAADGTARVWALDLDDLIQIARRELTRELTEAECRQYVHGPCPT